MAIREIGVKQPRRGFATQYCVKFVKSAKSLKIADDTMHPTIEAASAEKMSR